MKVTTLIAVRYLKSHRENFFFSWIALLSIFGIAIGVATMIVVLSVINGFETELRNRFLSANAHVLIYRHPGGLKDFSIWQDIVQKGFSEHITGTSPFVHSETMAKKSLSMHAMIIRGIRPKSRDAVQQIAHVIRPPESLDKIQAEVDQFVADGSIPDEPSIIIGVGLGKLMQAKIGDLIHVISPHSEDPLAQLKPYRVVGFYDSGMQHYDNKVGFTSLHTAQELMQMGSIVTGLEVGLKDPNNSQEVATLLRNDPQLKKLHVKHWKEYNRNVFEAMENERVVIAFIVALVAFVASFNILTTMFVSVSQKQRDISILKALGARNNQILAIFLKQSFSIGAIGSVIGVVLAFSIAKLIETYQFIDLPDIYLLASLPMSYEWKVYATIALAGVSVCTLAGLYPAWIASRVNPTSGFVSREIAN